MSIFKKSPWAYDTSEEFSTSIWVINGGGGKLHFEHETTKEKLVVKYSYVGGGTSKGAVINIAESVITDPSGAFTNVKTVPWLSFGPDIFPCKGWMVLFGATAGVFQPSFISHSGLDVGVAIFGFLGGRAVPFWGRFNSLLPSVGPALLLCQYYSIPQK